MQINFAGRIAALICFFFSLIIGDSLLSAIAFALSGLAVVNVISKIGKSFPLLELIFVVSSLQLLLGPYFAYRLPVSYFVYRMYIPEEEYMSLAVSGHILLLIGLMLRPVNFSMDSIKAQIALIVKYNTSIAQRILAVGALSLLIQPFVPSSIRFVIYLGTNLIYIGGILYFFNEGIRYRTQVYLATLTVSFVQGAISGLFHDFLLWSTFGVALIASNWKISALYKFFMITLVSLFLMVLQSAKENYRMIIAQSPLSAIEKMEVLMVESSAIVSNFHALFTPEKLAELNVRLNQGWITSAIIKQVPSKVPYENGKTLIESFNNALLPRFLFPDKLKAGGQDGFRKYTGLPLNDNTSMGIGLLGEAYINFGFYAGVFLFFWGWLLSSIVSTIERLSKHNVLIFIMTPLIFLQVIKVETDMITVINHLVKSIIFVAVIYPFWLRRSVKFGQ